MQSVSIRHLVLSPHPDDAALSLGACINAWRRSGEPAEVVTVFDGAAVGEPTPAAIEDAARYHGDPVLIRKIEDRRAAEVLNVQLLSLDLPELVHRRRPDGTPRCQSLDDIYGPLQSDDEWVVAAVAEAVHGLVNDNTTVHVPLAIGGHSDHRVVRAAAESLDRPFLFYEDQPYAIREWTTDPTVIWPSIIDEDIEAWFAAIDCYQSQLWNLFEGADWRSQFRHWLDLKGQSGS